MRAPAATLRHTDDGRDSALFKAIGDFLTIHKLAPSPENYTLAYQLVSNAPTAAARAVRTATSDGVRLTQCEADRIHAEHLGKVGGEASSSKALVAEAALQMQDFAALVESAHAEARDYGRDLADKATRLQQGAPHSSIPDLLRIAGTMVERAAIAEHKLAAAQQEAHLLREKLVSVRQDALSDPLTRLPNRRAFEERLEQLAGRRAAISLAICDIDRFKLINDRHGHGVGDRVLRMVAQLLEEHCQGHMVARLGGEEFVVILEGLGPSAAMSVLESARAALAARHFRVLETDAPVGQITFSAGVAGGWDDPQPLLKRADLLLYEAKRAGRNQVRSEAERFDTVPEGGESSEYEREGSTGVRKKLSRSMAN